jgi:hypothetical protein
MDENCYKVKLRLLNELKLIGYLHFKIESPQIHYHIKRNRLPNNKKNLIPTNRGSVIFSACLIKSRMRWLLLTSYSSTNYVHIAMMLEKLPFWKCIVGFFRVSMFYETWYRTQNEYFGSAVKMLSIPLNETTAHSAGKYYTHYQFAIF